MFQIFVNIGFGVVFIVGCMWVMEVGVPGASRVYESQAGTHSGSPARSAPTLHQAYSAYT